MELRRIEKTLFVEARRIDAVRRLRTIPSVGPWVALAIYAVTAARRRVLAERRGEEHRPMRERQRVSSSESSAPGSAVRAGVS
jgi:hypothetical protein